VEILPNEYWFSDPKEQPAQNDVTQKTSTLLRSFFFELLVILVTLKLWMSVSVFRIYPALGLTALALDSNIIYWSIVNQHCILNNWSALLLVMSLKSAMKFNQKMNCEVARIRKLILSGSRTFTFGFKPKDWCTNISRHLSTTLIVRLFANHKKGEKSSIGSIARRDISSKFVQWNAYWKWKETAVRK
jgi:hypothetical protein